MPEHFLSFLVLEGEEKDLTVSLKGAQNILPCEAGIRIIFLAELHGHHNSFIGVDDLTIWVSYFARDQSLGELLIGLLANIERVRFE